MLIKNLNRSIIASALLLTMATPLTILSAPMDDTTMWSFEWYSQKSPSTPAIPGIFVKLDDNGKYYVAWYYNPVVTGYMYMSTTSSSFEGQTYTQSNGDICTMSGVIKGDAASGSYYCKGGDTGTLTAVITVGIPPNVKHS